MQCGAVERPQTICHRVNVCSMYLDGRGIRNVLSNAQRKLLVIVRVGVLCAARSNIANAVQVSFENLFLYFYEFLSILSCNFNVSPHHLSDVLPARICSTGGKATATNVLFYR